MAYLISLKPGHPTGTMQRAGIKVSENEPVEVDKVPEAIEKDPWFVVKKIPNISAAETHGGASVRSDKKDIK